MKKGICYNFFLDSKSDKGILMRREIARSKSENYTSPTQREHSAQQAVIKTKRLKNIKKECFWDYDISSADIEKIVTQGTKAEKKALFSKIIYNSKDKLSDLILFSKGELEEFFSDFKPSYNVRYISKHLAVLRVLLLNENTHVRELEWRDV